MRTTSSPSCALERGAAPVRIAFRKSSSSSPRGSAAEIGGETMRLYGNLAGTRRSFRDSAARRRRRRSGPARCWCRRTRPSRADPTIVVRRSLLGASHDSSTCATVLEGNSRLMNATSGMPGMMQPRLSAVTCVGDSSEPVAQDREVVRTEVPHDADVGLVQAEVHATRRDEVDLAEIAGVDQLLDRPHGRAVQERVARHEHEVALGGQLDQRARVTGRSPRAASRRRRASRRAARRTRG